MNAWPFHKVPGNQEYVSLRFHSSLWLKCFWGTGWSSWSALECSVRNKRTSHSPGVKHLRMNNDQNKHVVSGTKGATVRAQRFGDLLHKTETAAPLPRNAISCSSWIKHVLYNSRRDSGMHLYAFPGLVVQICFTGGSFFFVIEPIRTWILKQQIWTFNKRTDDDLRMFVFLHSASVYAIRIDLPFFPFLGKIKDTAPSQRYTKRITAWKFGKAGVDS